MIHQYQNNGYHIVLDVNSGSVHVVDKIAYDVIGCLEAMNPAHTPETLKEEKTAEYLLEKLGDIYAEEDLRERQEIKSLFQDGLLQVVTAIKCLDEGVNIPSIRTAFIVASTRNPREFIQRRGRLLRRSPNKDYAEIYDFVTLPRELSCASHLDFEADRNIIIGEMARIHEFGKLSDNPAQADGMMNEIMRAYDVYLDIEEEMQKMEEEYDE